jgi:CBS-domain-containing membrane protein
MENSTKPKNNTAKETEFKRFAAKRVIIGILITVVALWVAGSILGLFEKPPDVKIAQKPEADTAHVSSKETVKADTSHDQLKKEAPEAAESLIHYDMDTAGGIMTSEFISLDKGLTTGEAVEYIKKKHHDMEQPFHVFVVDGKKKLLGSVSLKQLMFAAADTPLEDIMATEVNPIEVGLGKEKAGQMIAQQDLQVVPVVDKTNRLVGIIKADDVAHLARKEIHETVSHTPAATRKTRADQAEHPRPSPLEKPADTSHAAPAHDVPKVAVAQHRPKGVIFVEATIKPLDYELNERFWGWRPNDILDFTDNINNFQLGVLEVTRRTTVILTERISRTGSTAAFDENLEKAMNWFMIKSDRYWFPSPESKYKDGLKELEIYKEKLEKGEANFHTRTDNLIPLLMAFEDLLGSCEENLVKTNESEGHPVSFFKADDYFFYAKGVATAMKTILEAVMEDFLITVESRRGAEVLHHAIASCGHAAEIEPWMITNSSLSGILANHRANLAAPMSHARFYIGVLIKALST